MTKFIITSYYTSIFLLFFNLVGCKKKVDPVIELVGETNLNMFMNDEFIDSGATARDYKGKDISSFIKVSGTVTRSNPGTYTLIYSVEDKKGGKGFAYRKVAVNVLNSSLVGTYDVVDSLSLKSFYVGNISSLSGEKGFVFSELSGVYNVESNLTGKGAFSLTTRKEGNRTIINEVYSSVTNSETLKLKVNFKVLVEIDSSQVYEEHIAYWTKK
jgi:hypothetical protein